MASLFDTRRYLTDFDSSRSGNILTDVLVIGSGVAGARAAIEAADVAGLRSAVDELSGLSYQMTETLYSTLGADSAE